MRLFVKVCVCVYVGCLCSFVLFVCLGGVCECVLDMSASVWGSAICRLFGDWLGSVARSLVCTSNVVHYCVSHVSQMLQPHVRFFVCVQTHMEE